MSSKALFKIRPAVGNDANFILNSWLRRYRDAVSPKLVTDRVFFKIQHDIICKILAKPELRVLVAVAPDDENQIFGYIVAEDLSKLVPDLVMLHWVYCKGPFRRFGVAKALLIEAIGEHKLIHYSHHTYLTEFLDRNKTWAYNPAYIWSLL